jgi:hypothetical protein
MRRVVLMLGLAAISAVILPPATTAEQTAASDFTLGGRPCSLIPVPKVDNGSVPVGVGDCPGVRPGGVVRTDIGVCTMNFLFRAPGGVRYIGTAGHCILGAGPIGKDGGEKFWPGASGPVAKDGEDKRIGTFAFAVLTDPMDFALIRLDKDVEASPEMCYFGGPKGVNDDEKGDITVVHYWGNGIGAGATVPARSGVALGLPHKDHVYATGLAVPGDSGSGVISDDGRALGVLVTTGIHGFGFSDNGVDFGTMGITRLSPQLVHASRAMGVPLELVSAG